MILGCLEERGTTAVRDETEGRKEEKEEN